MNNGSPAENFSPLPQKNGNKLGPEPWDVKYNVMSQNIEMSITGSWA